MRATRHMMLIATIFVLLLVATACGNDAGTQTEDSEAPASSEAAEPTEATEPTEAAATEGGSETASTGSIKPLEEVCTENYGDLEVPEGFKVGLITDIGSVDDGTFNEYAYNGLKAAEECFQIETYFIETANEADYGQNIKTVLDDDPDVVVTVGFLLAEATLEAAKKNPDVNFIGVDQFQPEFPKNYVGIQYREDQAGFLAGVMAGLLTESNVIGVVGGLKSVPPVVRLVNSYRTGAESVNPDIQVLEIYNDSFTAPAKGKSDAEQFMGEGADVIFNAGGQTGGGGIRAAAEAGKWAIGVDQDEYFTTFSGGTAPGIEYLATSAVKRVDLGVFENIASAISGDFKGQLFVLDASNDGITYAPFHDAAVPEDAAATLEEVRQGLADGSIDTGIDPVTGEPK